MAEKALLPLFPLDLVLVPGETVPLHIFEPRYRAMITQAYAESSEFGVVRQSGENLESVGCAAKVREITERLDDGRFNVRAMGTRRFEIRSLDPSRDCLHGAVEFFADQNPAQPDASKVKALLVVATKVRRIVGATAENWDPNHPWLSFRIAGDLPLAADTKQRLLETRSEVERVELLTLYLRAVAAKRDRKKERMQLVRGNGRLRAWSGPSGEQH